MPELVSIIIPCHNRSDLLEQAIASSALQTWPHVEILVVDDASDEDIQSVVDKARRRHALGDRLKYIHQDRRGGSAARNTGVRAASGSYIQYLDSDDLLHPDKLTRQLAVLQAKPELDMVFCLDEQFSATLGDIRLLWNVPRRFDCSDDLDRYLHEDSVWAPASPLWRRATIERIGGWNEELACWQDWEFHVAALCAGIRYEYISEVLEYVRHHQGPRTSWTIAPLKREQSCFLAGKLAHEYLVRAGRLDDTKRRLLLLYFVRHVIKVAAITDRGSRRLAQDILAFARRLTWNGQRRAAITALWAVSRTPLLGIALELYTRHTSYEFRFQSLRNVVQRFAPLDPPEVLQQELRRSFETDGAVASSER